MKKNNTESNLRKASNQEMHAPPAFVWGNIEEELNSKKSKKRVALWWFGTGLIASLLIIFVAMHSSERNNMITEDVALDTTVNKSDLSNESISTDVYGIDSGSGSEPQDNSTITSTSRQKELETSSTPSTLKNTTQQKNIFAKNNNQTEKNNRINNFKKLDAKENQNNLIREEVIAELTEKKYDNPIVHSTPTILEPLNNNVRIQALSLSIASLGIQELNYSRPLLPYIECPKFDNKIELAPFVEFGILSGLHNLSFSENQNTALYNLRKETESSWYSVGAYSNVGLNISKNWHLSIGAEWTMSKDKFESKTEGITKMIVTFDPSTGAAIDTSFVSGSISNRGDLTYHFVDIPVNVGYSFSKNKWKYGIELSGLLNIRTITEGKMFNSAEGISTIKNQGDVYKNSVGLGFKSSLLFSRELNDNFSLQIRPTFKTYLNHISTDNYILPTKYRMFSVSVGLKKSF